jgi:hypothetical protein
MTKYTVIWHDNAKNQLAAMWVERKNRAAITLAANAIDEELKFDADLKGTPQPDRLRSLHIPPLQVLYAVRESDRIVEVLVARYVPALPPPGSNGQGAAGGAGE